MTSPHNAPYTPHTTTWPGPPTAVLDPRQAGYHEVTAPSGAPQQPGDRPYRAPQPMLAPQGPGFGWPAAAAPKPNRTPLLVSLVVAVVLLIGGGVGAFFLLAEDTPVPAPPGGQMAVATSSTGLNAPSDPTTTRTTTSAAPTSATPTTTHTTVTTSATPTTGDEPVPAPAPGPDASDQLVFASSLATYFVDLINVGDFTTASAMVCTPERDGFVTEMSSASSPKELELVDVQPSGDTMQMTLGAVTGGSTVELTMWPTANGYFLICSNPLTDEDRAL